VKIIVNTIRSTALLVILFFISLANADQPAEVCFACHGLNGNSSDPSVPNLAGQKQAYLVAQLKAFKEQQRKNPLMNAVAANLSVKQIDSLATFFSEQQVALSESDSSLTRLFQDTRLSFPEKFPDDYRHYSTVNRSDNKQVRKLYVNSDGFEAFKKSGTLPQGATIVMEIFKAKLNDSNEPIIGDDGYYLKDTLAAYATMENEPNWGEKMPIEIRNGDWKYAFFKPSKEHHPSLNMAKCMACHQPLADQSFMFSFESLKR